MARPSSFYQQNPQSPQQILHPVCKLQAQSLPRVGTCTDTEGAALAVLPTPSKASSLLLSHHPFSSLYHVHPTAFKRALVCSISKHTSIAEHMPFRVIPSQRRASITKDVRRLPAPGFSSSSLELCSHRPTASLAISTWRPDSH